MHAANYVPLSQHDNNLWLLAAHFIAKSSHFQLPPEYYIVSEVVVCGGCSPLRKHSWQRPIESRSVGRAAVSRDVYTTHRTASATDGAETIDVVSHFDSRWDARIVLKLLRRDDSLFQVIILQLTFILSRRCCRHGRLVTSFAISSTLVYELTRDIYTASLSSLSSRSYKWALNTDGVMAYMNFVSSERYFCHYEMRCHHTTTSYLCYC